MKKKTLSAGLFIVPLQMAEAGKLKDALSGTLHGAVTQPFSTRDFFICSEVYSSVV